MAHYDLLPSDAHLGADRGRASSISDLIRPNLRRAFALAEDGQRDERFRALLDALAQQHGGHPEAAAHTQRAPEATFGDRTLGAMLVSTALGGLAAMVGGAYGISLVVTAFP
jgi:hypothetical protein